MLFNFLFKQSGQKYDMEGKFLTLADKGGGGRVVEPQFLADIICEQPLTQSSLIMVLTDSFDSFFSKFQYSCYLSKVA